MIERHYFFSTQCPRNDGRGSYSFYSLCFSKRSWFPPNSNEMLTHAKEQAAKHFESKGIEVIALDITAFNRI